MGERQGTCPECKRPSAQEFRPFCSKRCADIDLGRWLNGGYAIAGGDADADEDGEQGSSESPPEGTQPPWPK